MKRVILLTRKKFYLGIFTKREFNLLREYLWDKYYVECREYMDYGDFEIWTSTCDIKRLTQAVVNLKISVIT